jgi:hypothetical protein
LIWYGVILECTETLSVHSAAENDALTKRISIVIIDSVM